MVARTYGGRRRRSSRNAILPRGVQAFFRRRAVELAGVVCLLTAASLLLALASYDPSDPSLNHATSDPAANLFGRAGAYAADLLLQSLGLAALAPALVLTSWGAHLLGNRPPRHLWRRIALVPIAVLLAAIALATVSVPAGWPLAGGLGGFAGALLLGRAAMALADSWVSPPQLALAAAFASTGALGYALAIPLARWAALARTGARWLVHSMIAGGLALRTATLFIRDETAEMLAHARPNPRQEPLLHTPHEDAPPAPVAAVPVAAPTLGLVEMDTRSGKSARAAAKNRQLRLELAGGDYELPPLDLLSEPDPERQYRYRVDEQALAQNAQLLDSVLQDFGVRGKIVKIRPGPVVTLYELEPAPGTKSSRVIGLADDIARSMSAVSARIAVVSGRNAIGIELPNAQREFVHLRELLASAELEKSPGALTLALGKNIGGGPVVADLSRMPHLLIAGTTGSGKSVGVNAMILSLLYRLRPDECKFIMIDPKVLELSVYDGIPHLLAPVVTDPKKSVVALKWVVREMENRYRSMSKLGVRNITGYNQRLEQARKRGEVIRRTVQTGFDPDTGKQVFEEEPLDLAPLPLIVVIVDEMADLMLVAGKEVEGAIQRLSQMARAAGIHIIMATQRPSVDVVTGTIKANFPTRISFQVTSKIDSRTILGDQGAEQLLGMGDMLYMAGGGRITRVHGPFVSDREVEAVVAFLKRQGEPDYLDEITEDDAIADSSFEFSSDGGIGETLYDQAVALVARERKASTSFIQRHLQIGYNRAARIIEQMEKQGVVSTANHVGRREVLVGDHAGAD